jgi:folate-binding protein YgfZ
MANPSPLQSYHDDQDAEFLPFGEDVQLVAVHDVIEVEYAALHRAAAVMDCPHRGLIELTGSDRADFLHRLTTGDVNGLQPGRAGRMLLLTTQGRIRADFVVLHGEQASWIDVDVVDVPIVLEELDAMLFGEDVQFADRTAEQHRLSIHGKQAAETLDRLCSSSFQGLEPLEHRTVNPAGVEARVYREDQLGLPGLHLWLPADAAQQVWEALIPPSDDSDGKPTRNVMPLGWMAYNMARIEAGRPLFHVDYGPDCLPGETGIVNELVSFTKGCYRGQEIVARMRDLGHPAKRLVSFRMNEAALPAGGSPITAEDSAEAKVIGAVTSSSPSPMQGDANLGIAMVKWGHHEPGTTLYTPAEGRRAALTVELLPRAGDASRT